MGGAPSARQARPTNTQTTDGKMYFAELHHDAATSNPGSGPGALRIGVWGKGTFGPTACHGKRAHQPASGTGGSAPHLEFICGQRLRDPVRARTSHRQQNVQPNAAMPRQKLTPKIWSNAKPRTTAAAERRETQAGVVPARKTMDSRPELSRLERPMARRPAHGLNQRPTGDAQPTLRGFRPCFAGPYRLCRARRARLTRRPQARSALPRRAKAGPCTGRPAERALSAACPPHGRQLLPACPLLRQKRLLQNDRLVRCHCHPIARRRLHPRTTCAYSGLCAISAASLDAATAATRQAHTTTRQ